MLYCLPHERQALLGWEDFVDTRVTPLLSFLSPRSFFTRRKSLESRLKSRPIASSRPVRKSDKLLIAALSSYLEHLVVTALRMPGRSRPFTLSVKSCSSCLILIIKDFLRVLSVGGLTRSLFCLIESLSAFPASSCRHSSN